MREEHSKPKKAIPHTQSFPGSIPSFRVAEFDEYMTNLHTFNKVGVDVIAPKVRQINTSLT
jgi:hypothetical protein